MSWLRRILRLTSGVRPRVVGTDLEGNQYLEVEARGSRRPRRTVKMAGVSTEDQYTEDAVPHEWERWLRGSRNDPPTHEELLQRLKLSEAMKTKIAEAEDRDAKLRDQEVADGQAVQRVKVEEHASAPSFRGDHAVSEDPTTTGKDFQPSSWKP